MHVEPMRVLARWKRSGVTMRLVLHSPAFSDGAAMPAEFTVDGADVSPPLAFGGVPGGAKSLALLVDDPDAPDPAKPLRTWCHWIVFNLPPACGGLPAGVGRAALPDGSGLGRNDSGSVSWRGPAPPVGRHRYVFRLFALDLRLPSAEAPSRADLLAAIAGHVIDEATWTGTYERATRGGPRRG